MNWSRVRIHERCKQCGELFRPRDQQEHQAECPANEPLSPSIPFRVDGVIDIETEDWDTFVLGALYYPGSSDYYETRDPFELFRLIYEMGGELWAHNGGKFDYLWWLDIADREGVDAQVNISDGRVTRIDVDRGRLILRDSYALVPYALEKLMPLGGMQKGDPGLPCVCGGEGCKGYCSIRRDMSEDHYRRVSQYLRSDCEGLASALLALCDYADANAIQLRGTVGGSAWATMRDELDLPPTDWTAGHFAFARKGYFGGRTQVFRPRAPSGHRYDIHSAYPAALTRTRIPHGERALVGSDMARKCYGRARPGIYEAAVTIRENLHIPPLPYRFVSGRIVYPVGRLVGQWTYLELAAAEEAGEITIEGFGEAMVWSDEDPLIAPFMRRIFKLRDRAGKGTPIERWLKFLLNAPTGKFAQRADSETLRLHPDPSKIRACEPSDRFTCDGTRCGRPADSSTGRCCVHVCTGRCRRWLPLGKNPHLWRVPTWHISDCAHVQWAAYLTAATRIEVRAQLLSAGTDGRDALYCDTDSVYSRCRLKRRVGDRLGDWGYEGILTGWYALGPKAYTFDDERGERKARLKGVGGSRDGEVDAGTFDRFSAGEEIANARGVMGLRSAARTQEEGESLFRRKAITRSNLSDGLWYGDRKLGEDGLTHPQTIIALEDAERERARVRRDVRAKRRGKRGH